MNCIKLSLGLLASVSLGSAAIAAKQGPVGSVTYTCPMGKELTWLANKPVKEYGIKYHASAAGGFGLLTVTLTSLPAAVLQLTKGITAEKPEKQEDGSWKWACTYTSDFYETASLPLTIPATSRFSSCTLTTPTDKTLPPSINCI